MNLENIVRHKGYKSLEEAEKRNVSGSDDSQLKKFEKKLDK